MSELMIRGNYTALVTPFKPDGSLDLTALRRHVKRQLSGGVDGLVPCGSTGEASVLNNDEYRQVVETVVAEARGRVPVIAGAGTNDTSKAVKYSKIAKQAGADGLLHVTPYYNKPTVKGLMEHFQAIASAAKLPIILYNIPGRTGLNMSPETIALLAKKIPQVIGVKEASGNITQIMEVISKAPKDFVVLAGDDSVTLPVIGIGGAGVISVISNQIPREFSDLVHAALDGDMKRAQSINYKWFDLIQGNFIETNPIPVKTALAMMGHISEVLRLPLTTMEPANRAKLKAILKSHGLTAESKK